MEEEFMANQEEKTEEDRSKVDDLRGSPMRLLTRTTPLCLILSDRSIMLRFCRSLTRISWSLPGCTIRCFRLLGFLNMRT
ncbi:hypothetical protein L6452_04118 [Arctium lappa]|uniref:Uncharacterized protein n=1 Tax=Arctium lappa TaxID=4217 RepID=A0ACB9FQ50_ARCLA|nr:hypothetical protein L6452_04118 [Arctium lappa]